MARGATRCISLLATPRGDHASLDGPELSRADLAELAHPGSGRPGNTLST
jgi:hypothetical protein